MAAEAEEGTAETGKRGKPMLLVAAIGLVVLLAGGGAGAYFLGFLGGHAPGVPGSHDGSAAAVAEGGEAGGPAREVIFIEIPDVLVNLQSDGQRPRFLKLRVALEVASREAADAVKTFTPRILDSFQLYLRALTVGEVTEAASLQRMKEELLARTNLAVGPVRVEDVLVKEMLVQ